MAKFRERIFEDITKFDKNTMLQKGAEIHWMKRIKMMKEGNKCTPVMTPDVLCETDVDGAFTVFTMLCLEAEPDALLARRICALSLPTSPMRIVVAIWRDCPRERCWGNGVFWSLDATLNVFFDNLEESRFSVLLRTENFSQSKLVKY